jgi:hypothetical protein
MPWNIVKLPSSPPTTIRRGLGSAVMMRSVGCGVQAWFLDTMLYYTIRSFALGGSESNTVLNYDQEGTENRTEKRRELDIFSLRCNADFEQRCPACPS